MSLMLVNAAFGYSITCKNLVFVGVGSLIAEMVLSAGAPVTVGALDGDSDMAISDDDHPLQSCVSSCLQTHPQPHQEAHDFLCSNLFP